MKRLTVILVTLALVLAGAAVVLPQDVPQAFSGLNDKLWLWTVTR